LAKTLRLFLPRFFLFLISFLIVISYSGGLGSTSNPQIVKGKINAYAPLMLDGILKGTATA